MITGISLFIGVIFSFIFLNPGINAVKLLVTVVKYTLSTKCSILYNIAEGKTHRVT